MSTIESRSAAVPCKEWTRARNPDGYGRIWLDGRLQRAHRVAYEREAGPIPPGMWVLHHCDNPSCVEPQHLYLGTPTDNARDRERRNRRVPATGARNGRAKLTADQVAEMRDAWRSGGTTKADLARRFAIGRTQVRRILSGEEWA